MKRHFIALLLIIPLGFSFAQPGNEFYLQAVEALNGTKGERDLPKALELMRKAALQGHGPARLYLGMMMVRGMGSQAQKIQGLAWIYHAKEKNIGGSQAMSKAIETELSTSQLTEAREFLAELKTNQNKTDPPVQKKPAKKPTRIDSLLAKAESGDAEALYSLSKIYLNGEGVAKDEGKSKTYLQKAAEAGQAQAREKLAKSLAMDGIKSARAQNNLEAIKLFQTGLKDYADSYDLLLGLAYGYNSLGLDHQEQEKGEEAEKAFRLGMETAQKLTQKHPQQAEGFLILAMATGNLAKFKGGKEKIKIGSKVEEYCKKAIQIDPNLGMAHSVLATYYLAVVDLPWLLKGFAKTFLGKLPDATEDDVLKLYETGVKASPDRIYTQLKYGQMLERLGKKEQARERYQKVLELTPHRSEEVRNKDDAQKRLKELGG